MCGVFFINFVWVVIRVALMCGFACHSTLIAVGRVKILGFNSLVESFVHTFNLTCS